MKAPAFLSTAGKRRFGQYVKQLPKLTESQGHLLAVLCQTWDHYLAAQAEIIKRGSVIQVGDRPYINPACIREVECGKQIVRLSKLFGLSPDFGTQEIPRERSALEEFDDA